MTDLVWLLDVVELSLYTAVAVAVAEFPLLLDEELEIDQFGDGAVVLWEQLVDRKSVV